MPAIAAALISAVVFAALHFSFARAVPLLTLGVVLGSIAIRTSTWLAIAVHFLNNAMAIVALEVPAVAATLDAQPTITLVAASAISAIGLGLVFWTRSR
jgi:membrane protease YdiL (CAAX protease family)